MKKIGIILFLALVLRLAISPLYHHSDADTYFYWAKYLWETKDFLFFLGKAVPNAMSATYPPIYYFVLFLWRGLYELIGNILWFINLNLPFFPSKIIVWYQQYSIGVAFNKLPAIFSDLGCGYLIYKLIPFVGGIKKNALLSSLLFLLLPATWYNSAYWGQIDSFYSVFILMAFFLAFKSKFLLAIFCMGVSALIKPTGMFVLPIFLIFVLKQKKIIDSLVGVTFLSLFAFLLYFAFNPINTIPWGIDFYFRSFRGEILDLVANAFNFWALIFGFDQRPDSSLILGIQAKYFGFTLFLIPLSIVIYKLLKDKISKIKYIYAAFLCAFASFLFLPRMHERYFYTALIFLAVLSGTSRKWTLIFITLSIIHFFNLYHFWWFPKIPFLINLLSNMFFIRFIIIISLAIFIYSFINYFKNGSLNNNR